MNSEFCSQCGHKNIFDIKPKFCSGCEKPFNQLNSSASKTRSREVDEDDDIDDDVPEYDLSKIKVGLDFDIVKPRTLAELLKEGEENDAAPVRERRFTDPKRALDETLSACKASREPIIID